MTTCWLFGCLFRRTNYGRSQPLSTDAYMANGEWDSFMTMSPNPNSRELKRNSLSTPLFLVSIVVG